MNSKQPIKLSDYNPYNFRIPKIDLDFVICEDYVRVQSSMLIEPLSQENSPLILQGENLELEELSIEGIVLSKEKYNISSVNLIIHDLPSNAFNLKIINRINPSENSSLQGLYLSKGMLVTQCEAEGFRRICFHPDRPDVLSKYRVRLEADLKKYPILLSNGNQTLPSNVLTNESRHEVIWEDPYPKPSYLFALVAGDLKVVKDTFCTASRREVAINLYVEEGDEPYTTHAIESLKKAMAWDQSVYGLEYDLDEYNIVAVRHFNMGAMENKSLNIFNSKLVLADSKITTDDELKRIESVIAHEYFHNWTGNRITCRDWFQLSLKEGLTVFRDQSFTSDLHSQTTKRIEDVSILRNVQFLEDSGPTSHPVKPAKYFAIDNFYTTTIYEKGAELIRMLYMILGHRCFMKGMELYVNRFDGSAATTEDFIDSIIKGACVDKFKLGFDINQFSKWYYQAGTPLVSIKRKWDSKVGKLTLSVHQSIPNNKENSEVEPLVIPLLLSIIKPNGRSIDERLLILKDAKNDFILENLPINEKAPVLSLFRQFSAPVRWESDSSIDETFHLFRFDDDQFSRWNAGQSLMQKAILARASDMPNIDLEEMLINSISYLIDKDRKNDLEDLSVLLSLPGLSELELAQASNGLVDPISLYDAKICLMSTFGQKLFQPLKSLLKESRSSCALKWPKGQGARKITGLAWSWLVASRDIHVRRECIKAVQGNSMTLARAALKSLQPIESDERQIAMKNFYELWKDYPVILDTWFSLEASSPRKNALRRVKELLEHPRFDPMAPNSVRAVLGGFSVNIKNFHAIDGSGYNFFAEQIIELDQRNPITASNMAKVFGRWGTYVADNSKPMYRALIKLSDSDLSSNTREIVDLILAS